MAEAHFRQFHELKTLPEHFAEVFAGRKPFEIRFNDRAFATGDILRLREHCPKCGGSGEVRHA